MGVQVLCGHNFHFIWVNPEEVQLLDPMVRMCLILYSCWIVFRSGGSFLYLYLAMNQSSYCFTCLPAFVVASAWDFCHSISVAAWLLNPDSIYLVSPNVFAISFQWTSYCCPACVPTEPPPALVPGLCPFVFPHMKACHPLGPCHALLRGSSWLYQTSFLFLAGNASKGMLVNPRHTAD